MIQKSPPRTKTQLTNNKTTLELSISEAGPLVSIGVTDKGESSLLSEVLLFVNRFSLSVGFKHRRVTVPHAVAVFLCLLQAFGLPEG